MFETDFKFEEKALYNAKNDLYDFSIVKVCVLQY